MSAAPPLVLDLDHESRNSASLTNLFEVVSEDLQTLNKNIQSRVLELKEQGVSEEKAMAVADIEYRAERNAKKKSHSRLKQIAKLQGKKPPPNPYPNAIKEIHDEERKLVRDRFHDPRILEFVQKMKEENVAFLQDRNGSGGF
ncbi:uncharacterized protein Fot_15968 [Forsythia ovata]|uniref:Uncharacterized protein n=1 Tax=Forsythia ovata TaxID=205694 RepID=A0ABD1WAN6_9LAMI